MHANGWESPPVLRRTGSSASVFAPRAFPLGCPRLKDECRSCIEMSSRKRKLHTKQGYEKRRVGMARAELLYSGVARPGERKLPLPKKYGNGSFTGIWAVTIPRHLGTRSPSGNARGGCRGCTPLVMDTKWYDDWRHNVFNFDFPAFFPKPLLRAEFRISPKEHSAEAGRIHIPKNIVSPCRVHF